MKKSTALILCLGLLFLGACTNKPQEQPVDPPEEEERTLTITFDPGEIRIAAQGASRSLGFTLSGGTDKNQVKATAQGGWAATVSMESSSRGSVTVTATTEPVDAEVLVTATDGTGLTALATLNCYKGTLSIADDAREVSTQGGQVQLKLRTDMDYTLKIGADWIHAVPSTKAMRDEQLLFQVDPNEGMSRNGRIELLTDGIVTAYAVIMQEGVNPDALGFRLGDGSQVFTFDKNLHQVSVFTVEDSHWLRFLDPGANQVYELGPVPSDFASQGSFQASLNDQPVSCSVFSYANGILKLRLDEQGYFVTRF